MTLIWIMISLNLLICTMGIRPYKTAGELNKIMRVTTALFLTHCKGTELVPYIELS